MILGYKIIVLYSEGGVERERSIRPEVFIEERYSLPLKTRINSGNNYTGKLFYKLPGLS
jgi:hypothetical protein